ncbi:MAG: TrmB family transcriptional regulator [Firmicutes bacterium]|nr:TrmB family transcriptional regulator [Bacillota bacterium]
MDSVEHLMQFNITRQEAVIYLTLLAQEQQSGYEVAKRTGISRSNAYTSLATLVEKGAAFTVEDVATLYAPVPIAEFCENRIRQLQKTKLLLLEEVPQKNDGPQGYITIKGQAHIVDKMRNMIVSAHERVYLSAAKSVLLNVTMELTAGIERGLKIVLITDAEMALAKATIYTMKKTQVPIRLIADSSHVLTGDLYGDNPTCLYSAKKNLVDLLKDSLKNEIQLIKLMKGST